MRLPDDMACFLIVIILNAKILICQENILIEFRSIPDRGIYPVTVLIAASLNTFYDLLHQYTLFSLRLIILISLVPLESGIFL